MFKYAIVRKPCKNFEYGITTSNLEKPNYKLALVQHANYIKALKRCGIEVLELKADERFPDSTFIEDTAIVDKKFAIIMNMGALSRKGEEVEIRNILKDFYNDIEFIKEPGTVEGGDIMKVEDHYFIGLSKRTNLDGANQVIKIINKYGYSATKITLTKVLHLKTVVAYVGENNLIITGEFIGNPFFQNYNLIEIDKEENYGANCIRVNDFILIPEGCEKLKFSLLSMGYKILEIDVSEFRKMDGGLSCLSLRL